MGAKTNCHHKYGEAVSLGDGGTTSACLSLLQSHDNLEKVIQGRREENKMTLCFIWKLKSDVKDWLDNVAPKREMR